MLIRFSLENFLSFKERQVLSLVAGKHTKHPDHVFPVQDKRILKSSIFFGANAAGKTNFFKGVRFARSMVLYGIKKQSLTDKHFRVNESCANKPGVFQFDFYVNGHFYSYGFSISYSHATVEEEWLYLCDKNEIAIFERYREDGKTVVNSSVSFSDEKQAQAFAVFAENVPDDKMLLQEISERKLIEHNDFSAFRDAMQWIKSLLVILPSTRYRRKANLVSEDESYGDLRRMLREFDTGIEDIEVREEKAENVLAFLPEETRNTIIHDIESSLAEEQGDDSLSEIGVEIAGKYFTFKKSDNSFVASQLVTNHGNSKDLFKLSDESDGTQRLFDLIPLYRIAKQPRVILVDELDRSFHTKLVQRFIQEFFYQTKKVGSQLIASVHDTNIMDLDLLRQDEIWFVARRSDHASYIYSLNRYQERYDKKVEKDYLLGRYGAIPCFSQLDAEITEDA